jgi:hypothetical protein
MLIPIKTDLFSQQPIPMTFELREIIAKLKTSVMLVSYFDPTRGGRVMFPIGDLSALRPDATVYELPGGEEAAALVAARKFLDEGDERGAFACLATIADETKRAQAH